MFLPLAAPLALSMCRLGLCAACGAVLVVLRVAAYKLLTFQVSSEGPRGSSFELWPLIPSHTEPCLGGTALGFPSGLAVLWSSELS